MSELSDVSRENWAMALSQATSQKVKSFVKKETDLELLRMVIEIEAEKDDVNTELIATINNRVQELR